MELSGKRILLVSPQAWGASKVSKHHYALELAERGGEVYFLDPPSKGKGKESFRIEGEVASGIQELSHRAPKKGLRFLPPFLRKPLMKRQVHRLQKACGVDGFDIVWSFEGSRFFDLSLFGDKPLKLFHMVDLVQDQNLSKVAASADIAFCTTRYIEEALAPYAEQVIRIPHGYRPGKPGVKEELREGGAPQIGYLGNLAKPSLDHELMGKLPESFPKALFHFFGPGDEKGDPLFSKLVAYPNVRLHGPVLPEEARAYLAAMDILLILDDVERYYKQAAAPHKMMDYFASGKAIVGTWMEEHREHADLIRMVERQEDFIPAFEEVLEHLDEWNAPELQERRKAIAEARTYDKLLDRILEKVRETKPSLFP